MGNRSWNADHPTPTGTASCKIDPTSIDLRLDNVREAKIWNVELFAARNEMTGIDEPELHLGTFKFAKFAEEYLVSPPKYDRDKGVKVCKRGDDILIRPGGFLLWQTKEKIGTPKDNPRLLTDLHQLFSYPLIRIDLLTRFIRSQIGIPKTH